MIALLLAAAVAAPPELETLAASASADGARFGLTFTAADFEGPYRGSLEDLSGPRQPHDAKGTGVPEPELVPFTDEEKKKGARARWKDSLFGSKYGDHLPRDGSGVKEAWLRAYGFRDKSVPGMIITQHGVPSDKWRRIHWQPKKARWSHFTEEQERAILAAMLSKLSQPKPDERNSARFECERLQPAVEKARAAGRDFQGYQRVMKAAVIRSYEREIDVLALRNLVANP